MKNLLPTVKPGQTIFVRWAHLRRSNDSSPLTTITVTSVGRKWAHLSGGFKMSLETFYIDGGIYSSPGRCYLKPEDYAREERASESWSKFRRIAERMTTPTIEQTEAAALALGIDELLKG